MVGRFCNPAHLRPAFTCAPSARMVVHAYFYNLWGGEAASARFSVSFAAPLMGIRLLARGVYRARGCPPPPLLPPKHCVWRSLAIPGRSCARFPGLD